MYRVIYGDTRAMYISLGSVELHSKITSLQLGETVTFVTLSGTVVQATYLGKDLANMLIGRLGEEIKLLVEERDKIKTDGNLHPPQWYTLAFNIIELRLSIFRLSNYIQQLNKT